MQTITKTQQGYSCKMCGFTGLEWAHGSMVDCITQYRLLVDELRRLESPRNPTSREVRENEGSNNRAN